MKTIYFVRHGQSQGNIGLVYQGADTPLTEEGLRQAQVVADRCKGLKLDSMVSGTPRRVQQTAQIISEKIGQSFELCDLFDERRPPGRLVGRSPDEAEAADMRRAWVLSTLGEGPRFEDGEHFDDITVRAADALAFLERREEDNILVVTSGYILKMFLACILFRPYPSPEEFKRVGETFHMENTGITVFHYAHPAQKAPGWAMWIWNDHAHLD